MRQPGPRVRRSQLESRIAQSANAAGVAVARYRDNFNREILIGALERRGAPLGQNRISHSDITPCHGLLWSRRRLTSSNAAVLAYKNFRK